MAQSVVCVTLRVCRASSYMARTCLCLAARAYTLRDVKVDEAEVCLTLKESKQQFQI